MRTFLLRSLYRILKGASRGLMSTRDLSQVVEYIRDLLRFGVSTDDTDVANAVLIILANWQSAAEFGGGLPARSLRSEASN